MRVFPAAAALVLAAACAHGGHTPAEEALIKRADCKELLLAADSARAQRRADAASELAAACPADKLLQLVDPADPAAALLWCGRARAAQPDKPACEPQKVAELAAKLSPHLTLGPPEEGPPDPLLASALEQLGPSLNLSWEPKDPDVIVGKLSAAIDHATSNTVATVPDAKGNKQRVPAVQHRFVAKAEAQVEIAQKTRVLRATDEVRDNTWAAAPKVSVAAKFEPSVPPEDELKKRAALAWLRALAKALAAAPPEGVDVTDVKGCVAYGLSLNLGSGDTSAAANGAGDPAKVAACEKLLGEPAGAGIPVP